MVMIGYWLGCFICLSATVGSVFGIFVLGTFESWLSSVTAFTGSIWFICRIIQRKHSTITLSSTVEKVSSLRQLFHSIGSFFPVLLFVFVLRGFIVEPFRIPSGSMLPTLHIGDFVLVNKSAYGWRLPVTGDRLAGSGTPERGDVVVFRFPDDVRLDYIKRIIGIPGDTVSLRSGRLYLNDQLVPTEQLGLYQGTQAHLVGGEAILEQERLFGHEHLILNDINEFKRSGSITVPDNHYFVMGDNRDHSSDSRIWGLVPDHSLKGKAFFIWLSWGETFAYERIGTVIQ